MDVRKVTRNPGWWRLFIVLAGLWYGGWLVGGVVMFSQTELEFREEEALLKEIESLQAQLIAEAEYQNVDEIRQAFYKAAKGDDEEKSRLARLLTRIEGSPPNWFDQFDWDQFDSEPEYPFADLIPPEPWYRDIDVLGTIAAIILFPWIVFFNLCLMRYVIEGFILERE